METESTIAAIEQDLIPFIPATRYAWANQVRGWAQSISPNSGALSQKPKWHNKVITKIDVTRLPFSSSPSSPFLSSIERRRKVALQSIKTENLGDKELLRRWANYFQDPPYL